MSMMQYYVAIPLVFTESNQLGSPIFSCRLFTFNACLYEMAVQKV